MLLWSQISTAIINGENALANRYPSIVGLVVSGQSVSLGQFCAGVLVAPQWVVTAAHCVSTSSAELLEVVTGLYALNQASGTARIAVTQVIRHPEADSPPLKADIALLKLASAASQAPALLFADANSLSGASATAVGWGYTQAGGPKSNILQQVALPIVSNTVCDAAYAGIQTIYSTMVCGGHSAGGVGICTHDSGGPLFISRAGQDVLVGIASFSQGCALAGLYSGFARISALLGFIEQYVSNSTRFVQAPVLFMPPILMLLLE